MSAIDVLREALVRPYREIKEPSFFALDELPQFRALAAFEQLQQAAEDVCEQYGRHELLELRDALRAVREGE